PTFRAGWEISALTHQKKLDSSATSFAFQGFQPGFAALSRSIRNGWIVRVGEVVRLGSTCSIKHWTLNRPRAAKSCLMVDKGGRKKPASGMSSKPTSEIFCGIWMEFSSKARIAPNAI